MAVPNLGLEWIPRGFDHAVSDGSAHGVLGDRFARRLVLLRVGSRCARRRLAWLGSFAPSGRPLPTFMGGESPLLAHRSLIAPAAGVVEAALGLGLLPTGATAAPGLEVDTAFTPTLTFLTCPADVKPASTKRAELRVPLDWQTPDEGRTTTIALRVIPSAQGRGGFTFYPGGPGGSGIDFHRAIYADLPAQVRDRFDYAAWDPCGVGLSGPALVDRPATEGVGLPLTGPVDWQAYWEQSLADFGEANAACLAANPDAVPYLGTWRVVRDLEAMRVTLGYRQWNYWGMSYGTRIARPRSSSRQPRLPSSASTASRLLVLRRTLRRARACRRTCPPAISTGTGTITRANPPVFVLATGDAATPWIWGRGMANVFAGSRVISYDSTEHVTYLGTPSACVNNPVTQYLLTLQRRGADTSCRFIASRPPVG